MEYLSRIRYTSRDFDTIRADCIGSIQNFVPEYTDHNESDLGIVLIDHFAGIEDQVNFYIDKEVNECFIDTAQEFENVVNLLKLIAYTVTNYVPASVNITFQLEEAISNDIIIPANTRVQCDDVNSAYIFNIINDISIPAGQLGGTGAAFEGTFFAETLGTSDGSTPYQEFELTNLDWLDDHLVIYEEDTEGIQTFYNRVNIFEFSDYNEPVYRVEISEFKTKIIFGNTVHGKIPALGSEIKAEYYRGHGRLGNVSANTIKTILDPIYDVLGNEVDITVNNSKAATGGKPRETANEARINGPASLKTMHRAVTLEDYNTFAKGFRDPNYGSVTKASAVLNTEYYTSIDIYVLCEDQYGYAELPSNPLKEALFDYIETVRIATTEINIKDAILKPINIDATVYVMPNYNIEEVEAKVMSLLDSLFLVQNADFGANNETVALSDLYSLLNSSADGVAYVLISNPSSNIPIGKHEFPIKGTLNIDFVEVE